MIFFRHTFSVYLNMKATAFTLTHILLYYKSYRSISVVSK